MARELKCLALVTVPKCGHVDCWCQFSQNAVKLGYKNAASIWAWRIWHVTLRASEISNHASSLVTWYRGRPHWDVQHQFWSSECALLLIRVCFFAQFTGVHICIHVYVPVHTYVGSLPNVTHLNTHIFFKILLSHVFLFKERWRITGV